MNEKINYDEKLKKIQNRLKIVDKPEKKLKYNKFTIKLEKKIEEDMVLRLLA